VGGIARQQPRAIRSNSVLGIAKRPPTSPSPTRLRPPRAGRAGSSRRPRTASTRPAPRLAISDPQRSHSRPSDEPPSDTAPADRRAQRQHRSPPVVPSALRHNGHDSATRDENSHSRRHQQRPDASAPLAQGCHGLCLGPGRRPYFPEPDIKPDRLSMTKRRGVPPGLDPGPIWTRGETVSSRPRKPQTPAVPAECPVAFPRTALTLCA